MAATLSDVDSTRPRFASDSQLKETSPKQPSLLASLEDPLCRDAMEPHKITDVRRPSGAEEDNSDEAIIPDLQAIARVALSAERQIEGLELEEAMHAIGSPLRCSKKSSDPLLDTRTTLLLNNLPVNYSRDMLLPVFDGHGYSGLYDFIFVPVDFKTLENLGYAYINFITPRVAAQFMDTFNGYEDWWHAWRSGKTEVSWSKFEQGLHVNIERYRNSPVMHETVPDIFKPALFWSGVRHPFPPPTKKIRAPRSRALPSKNSPAWAAFEAQAATSNATYVDPALSGCFMPPAGWHGVPNFLLPSSATHASYGLEGG